MATAVVLPRLGLNMVEGTIEKWFKKEGDPVEKGEPLVCIQTEKVSYEYESPASGVLRKIVREVNDVVPVSETIGIIGSAEEDISALLPPGEATSEGKEEKVMETRREVAPSEERRVFASPFARKIAKESGIDLNRITGTGPGGRVTKDDVLGFAERQKGKISSTAGETTPCDVMEVRGIRRVIGQRMTESARTIPHISLSVEVDMSELLAFRARILKDLEKEKGIRISVTEVLVKIVSLGLKKYPVVNSTFEGQRIKIFKEINLGVAMAAGEGLIVPVVHKADERSVSEISSRVKELNQKAQTGTLSLEDVTGGTFTLTNLGMYGIDKFTAIINPPQCAILAVGKVSEKPAVEERRVVIKPMAWLTLSADHRILDGKQGAEFLSEVKRLIENPYLALV